MKETEIKNILVFGAAGGLANQVIKNIRIRYSNTIIYAVDSRKIKTLTEDKFIKPITMNYSLSNIESLFRNHQFDIVYHLARSSLIPNNESKHISSRLNNTIKGIKKVLELSLEFSVKKIIILSSFHVYGALSDNPVYIKEDANLRATVDHPDLNELVDIDQIASNWLWKNKSIMETILLRPCNIVGPYIKNAITLYLKSKITPQILDYNPMLQFIHSTDMAKVLLKTIEIPTGIYNIAPESVISIKEAKNLVSKPYFSFPLSIITPLSHIISSQIAHTSSYLIDNLKYPCLINTDSINLHLGNNFFKFNSKEALLHI